MIRGSKRYRKWLKSLVRFNDCHCASCDPVNKTKLMERALDKEARCELTTIGRQ